MHGKLTYSSLIAMLLVSLLGLGEDEAAKVAEAIVLLVLFGLGIYGRWRVDRGRK